MSISALRGLSKLPSCFFVNSSQSTHSFASKIWNPISNTQRIPTMHGRGSIAFKHISKLNDSIFCSKVQGPRVPETPKADNTVVRSGVSLSFWAAVLLAIAALESQKKEPAEEARAARLQPYFDLLKEHPLKLESYGKTEKGGFEIVTDLKTIAEFEKRLHQPVGIVGQDSKHFWIKDLLKFSNGTYRTHFRRISKNSTDYYE